MGEYYAEHESIAEVSTKLSADSTELDNSATEISVSARRISRSQTLESLGYSNLTSRSQASVSRLSTRIKEISSVLDTVSALYADYEGRVIAALDESTSAGNNYSRNSRHETRSEMEQHSPGVPAPAGSQDNQPFIDSRGLVDYTNPSGEQMQAYTVSWLLTYHPDLLEQIYDRLHSPQGAAAAATVAGIGGMAAVAGATTASGASGAAGIGAQSVADMTAQAGGPQAGAAGVTAGAGAADAGAADAGGAGGAADAGGAGGGAGAGEDWVADMLNDAVDSDAAQAAQGAIGNAASVTNPGATQVGPGAMSDGASMGFATDEQSGFSQLMGGLGSTFVGAVQRYGVQAGILAGGAGAAYASSGFAIEAVAHCAEFVATRCMPGVNGFMSQAASVVRVTRVSICMVVGNIVQGVSGLVG